MKRKLFVGHNSPGEKIYKGTEHELAHMYGLQDFGLVKGPPGGGKGEFVERVTNNPIFDGHLQDNYMCSGTEDARDGVVFPKLGIGYIDATKPHEVNPSDLPEGVGRDIDLHASVYEEMKPNPDKLSKIMGRRLEYYAESNKHMTEALKSKEPYIAPNPKEVEYLFQQYDKILTKIGAKKDPKLIDVFIQSLMSSGRKDMTNSWAEPGNTVLMPCSEETTSEVVRLLAQKYGGYIHKHWFEPEKMHEGAYISLNGDGGDGGIIFKQHPGFEKKMDGEHLEKAVTALQGADIVMHQEIEALYANTSKRKVVNYERNNALIKQEIDRHTKAATTGTENV